MGKRILIALAVVALGALFYFRSHPAVPPLSANAIAPEFSLPDLSGKPLSLSSYRGKVVLLDFWATWCEPCKDEIPHLIALQNKYGDQGLQIIGVSMDDGPEPVRNFYQRYHMNYPVVIGTANTGELYGGILGLPIAFVIGRNGHIYSKHIGATDVSVFEKETTNLLK